MKRRRSHQLEGISLPKYKYSFNDKTFDLSLSTSLDAKIGAYRAKPTSVMLEDKNREGNSFTLDKLVGISKTDHELTRTNNKEVKTRLKLPNIRRKHYENPELKMPSTALTDKTYYMARISKALEGK